MDPRIIDAMRSVRALEEGIVMDDEDQYEDEDEQEADVQPDPKRRRLENGPADSPPPPPNPSGLLSADTLEGLKYFTKCTFYYTHIYKYELPLIESPSSIDKNWIRTTSYCTS